VYTRWERKNMHLEGLVAGPRGEWQITQKGRDYLKNMQQA
jgi:restriction endonuclease Mrr